MSHKVIHYFMNENHTLLEVKKLGVSDEAPKDQKYFWLSIPSEAKSVEHLRFLEMSQETVNGNQMNVRSFSEGELRFDDHFAKLIIHGNGQILMNESQKELPSEIEKKVNDFFS